MKNRQFFKYDWKDYFYLPKEIRRGFIVLFSILSIEIVALLIIYFSPVKHQPQDLTKFNKEVEDFLAAAQSDILQGSDSIMPVLSEKSIAKGELFPFNPNNLPAEDWKKLGFSEKQIRVIKNYELKGGTFISKKDVKKMYCISEKEFNRIEPYIIIPKKPAANQTAFSKTFPSKELQRDFLSININTADTTEFEKLKGIGPVKARIIYQYREKLGGFYSVNQLLEVWGMNDSLFKNIEPHLTLSDTTTLKKINLNKAEVTELGKHPYIGFNLARIIVNYRKEHGSFKDLNDLSKIPAIKEQLYKKMIPYLTVLGD